MKQIGFTKEELYEINDAVVPLLRRYLETGDPEGHERQHGTVTNLLGITKKVAVAVFGEGDLPASLVERGWIPIDNWRKVMERAA